MSDPALANWVFEKSGADWIGRCTVNGRRTALKVSLQAARADAEAGRYVCKLWPACSHRDADACTRAIAEARRMKRAT